MIITCLLAAALAGAAPPRVRVVTTGDEMSLYDRLVVRLLQEGYAVAGDDDAEIDLTISPSEVGWTVHAQGRTSETFGVSVGDDVDVAHLELLHRAIDALGSVEPREQPANATTVTFAIDLAPTFEAAEQAVAEADIALAVLEGGGSLTPDRTSAKFVICAAPHAGTTQIDVASSDEPCPPLRDDAAPQAPPRQHTRQLVEAVLLGRNADEPAPVPEVEPEPAHDIVEPPIADERPASPYRPTWRNARLRIRGGVAAGAIGRITQPDAVVAASMFFGLEPGASLWVDLQLWPERRYRDLLVFETVSAVGLRIRAFTAGRFSLDLGGLVGLQTHSYDFDRTVSVPPARYSGIALDWSLEGATGFAIRLWNEHELQLLFRAGRSGHDRHHVFRLLGLWDRDAWRIGATLGITFGRTILRR